MEEYYNILENGKKYIYAKPREILSKGMGIYQGFTFIFGNKEKNIFVAKANNSRSAFYIFQSIRYRKPISIEGDIYFRIDKLLPMKDINYLMILNHNNELIDEINFEELELHDIYIGDILRVYEREEDANYDNYILNSEFNGYKESLK